jgi:hypothetical protein
MLYIGILVGFPYPSKTYVLSVMHFVYREGSAVFLHPYTTYVLSIEVNVMKVSYMEIRAVLLHTYCA